VFRDGAAEATPSEITSLAEEMIKYKILCASTFFMSMEVFHYFHIPPPKLRIENAYM
jgi:hypothetical protein